MKYTIELTSKQKAQMDCIIEIVHRYVGFNPKLEPIKTTNVEDTNEYDRGYTQAIADYRKFERFFNSVGMIEVFEDIRNTDGTVSIDMILQYLPMPEIMARIKAYEEKKKAEEEARVGDELIYLPNNTKFYVIAESPKRYKGIYYAEYNKYLPITICDFEKDECKKTGRHIDEIEQLLDKLRGEDEQPAKI